MTPPIILACGGKKLDHAAPALELYIGSYFTAARRWAQSVADPGRLFVISARYGLVRAYEVLDPYDQRMALRPPDSFVALVVAQAGALGLAAGPAWFAGGRAYLDVLRAAIPAVVQVASALPAGRAGRGIGAQLAWYARHYGELPSLPS
jgi:hypothetical protein